MNAIVEQINSAGNTFVEFALPMLIQSGVLIVILLLADFLLRKKVKAVFRYWIWMLVLVKLVLPTSLSSPLSLGYLFGDKLTYQDLAQTASTLETAEPAPADISPGIDTLYIQPNVYIPPTVPITSVVEPAVPETVRPPAVPVTPLAWQGIVFLVWLAVVITMGLLLLQRAFFVRGLVAQAKKAGRLMNDELAYCCASMRIKYKVGLKVSPNATTPSVCGLIRPVILVPWNLVSSLGASRLRTVLMHELAHIKRCDLWVNLAQTALQIIYFYNPLLWLANCVVRRIREQAVDEAVLVAMGERAQRYPQTLVDVAKMAFKRPALSLRLIGVVESESALAGRIKHILGRPTPKTTKLGVIGVLAVIITAAVLLPMARAREAAFAGQGGPLNIMLAGVRPDGSDDIYDGGGNKIAENTFANIAKEWGEDEQHRTFIFELPVTEEPILFSPFLKIKPAGAKRDFGTGQHPLLYYSAGKLMYSVAVDFPRTYKKVIERRVKKVDLTLRYYYGQRGTADFVFTGPFMPGQTVKAEGGADCELTPKEDRLTFSNHPAAFFKISSETRFDEDSVLIYDTSGRRYLIGTAGGRSGSGGTYYNYRAEGLTLNSIACVTVGEKPYEAAFKNVVVSYQDQPVPDRMEFLDEMCRRLDLTGLSSEDLDDYKFESPADAIKVIDIVRGEWYVRKVFDAIMYSKPRIELSSLDPQAQQKVRSAAARWAAAGHPNIREMGICLGLVGGWPEFMDMALDWLEQDIVVYDMGGRTYRGLEEKAKGKVAGEVQSYPIALNSEQAERLKKIILRTDSPRLGMRLFRLIWRADEDLIFQICWDLVQDERPWIWWPAMRLLFNRCNEKLRPFGNLPEKMQKRLILVYEASYDSSRLFDVSSSGKDYETVAKEAYAMLPGIFTARLARMNSGTCRDVRQVMAKRLEREIATKAMTDFLREISTESNQRLWAGDSPYFGTCCSTAYYIARHINSLYDVNIDNLGKYETRENSEAIPHHISQLKQLIAKTLQWYNGRSGAVNESDIAAEVGMADRVEAQAGPLDHFVGKYALAGHPDTAAFEITKKGDVFIFRDLGSPIFKMDLFLKGLVGRSFEMEKGKDNLKFNDGGRGRFRVRYKASENLYYLDRFGRRGMVQDGVVFELAQLIKIPPKKPGGIFAATLPNGVTVELVGVCEHPSKGKQWWRPDGTLLEDRPYEEFSSYHSMNGGKGYELVWRLSSDEDIVYEVESADQRGSAGLEVLRNEKGLQPAIGSGEFYGVIFFFSPGLSQTAIKIGMGLDRNWKTIASLEGDVSKAASSINNVHLYPAVGSNGRTYIDAAYRFPEGRRQAYRLVAVDTSNKQHIMRQGSETKGRGSIHCRKQIELPLKQIKTIYFQTHPLQWVTFENVSLRPGMKTNVQVEVEEAEPVLADEIEAARAGISLPIRKILSAKTDKGGSFEWETTIDPRVRFRHGWYTVEDGAVREHVGGGSQIPDEGKLNLKLDVEVKDNMLNLKVQRVHDLDDGSRTAAEASKTPVPAGAYLKHVSSIDSAVLSSKHLTLWQGDFIRNGKVVKSVMYAAYLTTPDDRETGFKPPVLQKAEIVTAEVRPDLPVESEESNESPESKVTEPTVPKPVKTRGGISGVVVNSVTGKPIAGAYVGVGDFGDSGGSNYSRHRSEGFHDKTKTDAQGRFELDGLVFTDKHRELEYHPLVVTHPDFIRHDEKIEMLSSGPAPEVKVSLRPAAKIEVTIVDVEGNPIQGQWLLRLEALDGRRFIPPGSDPHLSSFASNIWAHWPDLRANMGVSNGFTFTELDTGEYSIEALKFQLVDNPTPGNIWKPTITYHGSIPSIRIQAGQAKQVQLAPQDHQTKLTITPPEFPDKLVDKLERSSQMPLMCLISRSPGALLWDDGRIRHLEDQRLGRIDKKRFFRGFFIPGEPLTINNLPPDSYSLFTMAVYGQVAGYLIGARADLKKGDKITVDILWRQPTGPSMFGPNRSFDYPVNLEAKDYSLSELCEILTKITQSHPHIIADPSIGNEKLSFGKGDMSVWDVLEKLYLDNGWRVDEGEEKTLIVRPAEV